MNESDVGPVIANGNVSPKSPDIFLTLMVAVLSLTNSQVTLSIGSMFSVILVLSVLVAIVVDPSLHVIDTALHASGSVSVTV